jgi:hypothetical protein
MQEMLRQSAYAFSNDPSRSADHRLGGDDPSAVELRAELNEFLAETMLRLESLSDALMQCQIAAPTDIPAVTHETAPTQQAAPTQETAATRVTEAAYQAAPTEARPAGYETTATEQIPATYSTPQSCPTPEPQLGPFNTAPEQARPQEPTAPAVSPGGTAALPTTNHEVSAAGGLPATSPTPNFSAANPNVAATDPAADPTDRLAAIKLRLAKQIENA